MTSNGWSVCSTSEATASIANLPPPYTTISTETAGASVSGITTGTRRTIRSRSGPGRLRCSVPPMEDLQLEDLIADVVAHPTPERVACDPAALLTAATDGSFAVGRRRRSLRHFLRKWLH
jgi:hypothetical protein